MSVLGSPNVLRPGPEGWRRSVRSAALSAIPLGFAILRRVRPIFRLGSTYVVTLYDDVREVFADAAFQVPYKPNLDVITGNQPFFLGMADTPDYHAGIDAMRRVVRADDLPLLAEKTEALADRIVATSGGRVEVVGDLVRRVSFDVLAAYFGIPAPGTGRLDVWATRLFEFQFASSPGDRELLSQVEEIAPAFRAHVDREIERRRSLPPDETDILGRCLALQLAGQPGYGDVDIRTAILCMIVGGPPQPAMVVPQAMEQLLRRPAALAAASAAARADDDDTLRRIVLEAMRFDPLAPGLPRIATKDAWIAQGTRRQRLVPKGATVIAGMASAMMDDRRIPSPRTFDPSRGAHQYLHFGHGLHECFGRYINAAILHLMLKPLLKRPHLRRAGGAEGHLSKNGPFAERLVVEFDRDETASMPLASGRTAGTVDGMEWRREPDARGP